MKICRKFLIFVLLLCLLLPYFAFGEHVPMNIERVVERGYFGQGGLNLNGEMNRAEFATVSVRLLGLENKANSYIGKGPFKDVEKFQGGWAIGYTAIAHSEGIMEGNSNTKFNPSGKISYIEMLTVFMRILGYEDGIDFVKYPDDYYKKALEIGLGDIDRNPSEKVNRGDVALYMEKLLDMKLKDKDNTLIQILDMKPNTVKAEEKIYISELKFNTSVAGILSGKLNGRDDFVGYKVELLSLGGKVYDSTFASKNGEFKILNFDIGIMAKIEGYKYRVYDENGKVVLEGNL